MYGESFKFLNIRYFSNYYTLHRSDLAARAASLDPRLNFGSLSVITYNQYGVYIIMTREKYNGSIVYKYNNNEK